jgi:addiction module RelE/StbE family toxin
MRIDLSSSFLKAYRKLSIEVLDQFESKQNIFLNNPFHFSLKTHKLSGKMSGYYAFSINYKYRVIFRYIDKNFILFLDIGTHDIYD